MSCQVYSFVAFGNDKDGLAEMVRMVMCGKLLLVNPRIVVTTWDY